jgi:hypothetical protein
MYSAFRASMDRRALSIVVVGDKATIDGPVRDLEVPITYLDYEGTVVG